MIPLTFAEKNTPYFIKRIQGKDEARRHLNNLGFIEGEEISVINELAGNLIIAVKESYMAARRPGLIWLLPSIICPVCHSLSSTCCVLLALRRWVPSRER
ncbi:MAG: ferrous iron transport protein A [Spirochaetia bacterium]|nr:ferrous iron transport protein A [Spirochaetia bacterium]MBR4796365.1 ferrous iron transport protein A [Spirochaetia bacterium]MBR5016984.1 ferrous iron transport protein A [Spirochaetia bacterium]